MGLYSLWVLYLVLGKGLVNPFPDIGFTHPKSLKPSSNVWVNPVVEEETTIQPVIEYWLASIQKQATTRLY